MKVITRFVKRLLSIGLIYRFFWHRRLWWLIPMVTVLLLFVVLMLLAQVTPLGPFIYALF